MSVYFDLFASLDILNWIIIIEIACWYIMRGLWLLVSLFIWIHADAEPITVFVIIIFVICFQSRWIWLVNCCFIIYIWWFNELINEIIWEEKHLRKKETLRSEGVMRKWDSFFIIYSFRFSLSWIFFLSFPTAIVNVVKWKHKMWSMNWKLNKLNNFREFIQ